MEPYVKLQSNDLSDVVRAVQDMARKRDEDISEQDQLFKSFDSIGLHETAKIPTSSTDTAGDNYGAFSYDMNNPAYLYLLVNNNGTPQWRRISLSTF